MSTLALLAFNLTRLGGTYAASRLPAAIYQRHPWQYRLVTYSQPNGYPLRRTSAIQVWEVALLIAQRSVLVWWTAKVERRKEELKLVKYPPSQYCSSRESLCHVDDSTLCASPQRLRQNG